MLGELGAEAAGACLYQVVVQGARFSATCSDGHRMVMELLERFHLLDPVQALPESSPPPEGVARIAGPLTVAPTTVTASKGSVPAAAAPTPDLPALDANTLPAPAEPTLFSEFRDLYLTNLARNRKHPNASGYRQQVYVLKLVEDLVGDKPLNRITVDDANSVARALEVWPAYLHNLPDYKDMSAHSVVAKAREEHPQPLQKGTQRKHILCINAFFHWCAELKAIDQNPFRVVQLTRYKEDVPQKKSPFSPQDLRALFDPVRQLAHAEPHKYWIPMIAMYSGMRVNEIAQLHVADIKSEEVMDEADDVHRIHYFDVTPFRKGQQLKTKHSCRRIPIHSKLIDAGLLCYLDEVRAAGAAHLFPGLPWKEGGPGRAITRWFNRDHLRKLCGITDRRKTFHCFRHTLTSLAERCGIPTSIRRTINGHADGRGVDEARYIARGSLLECKQALEKLLFPELDVAPYAPGRFEPYLSGVTPAKVTG